MTDKTNPTASSYALLRSAEAVSNWRALAMTGMAGLATLVAATLTAFTAAHSPLLGLLLSLITLVVMLIGYSSVGILLMRQAQGQRVGFVDAVLQAVFTAHRLIAVGILLLLGYLLMLTVVLGLFLVCKIPGVGPLLYAFAFPLAAVLIGVGTAGLWYVGYPLAAPAIWEGNTAVQAVARLMHIGRRRLLQVIVNMLLLLALVAVITIVVFGILFYGSMISTSLSTAVGVGGVGALKSMFAGLFSPFGGGYGRDAMMEGMAYGRSFGFGAGLLLTIGLTIPFLTFINGSCLIYLQAVNGVDFSASEAMLQQRMEQAKRQAEQARERAGERIREAREAQQARAAAAATATAAPVVVPEPPPVSAALPASASASQPVTHSCTSCKASMDADDLFCGECGAPRRS